MPRWLAIWVAVVFIIGGAVAGARRSDHQAAAVHQNGGDAPTGRAVASSTTASSTPGSTELASTTSTTTGSATRVPSPSAQPADRCDGRGTDDGAGGCRWFPTTIEGQITDESGAGVPAICVDLNSPLPALSDVTAGDGTYRIVTDAQAIDGLGDVRLRDCSQADPGWADQPRVPIKIVPGTTNRLDAVMIGAAAVNGHVVDVNGAPVAGACVRSVGADDELTNTVRTDDSGYFRITHIRTGDNRAEAQQECPVQYLSSETPFTVGPGETAAVTITVTRPGQVPNS